MTFAANRRALLGGTVPAWLLRASGAPVPDLDIDFAGGRAWSKAINRVTSPGSLLTTSRASVGTASDLAGNWSSFAANVPRVTNQGLLIEESRSNGIRVNNASGAAAGTPGTLPPNWSWQVLNGLSTQVVGVGTSLGINTIDVRLFGTTVGAGTFTNLTIGLVSDIAALYGQTWARSSFLAIVGGSTANLTGFSDGASVNSSVPAYIGELMLRPNLLGSLTPTLQRFSASGTAALAATATAQPYYQFNYAGAGSVIDITLRVGWTQLENNVLINSTVASATVKAGGSGGTNGAVVLTVVGGSGTAATLNGTIAGNALTAIGSVATAGSYSTFPPGPAAVTGGGLVGATVNLTPTNNAAQGFATSPIVTSGVAVNRSADAVTTPVVVGSAFTPFGAGVPLAPTSSPNAQVLVVISDGTNSNRFEIRRSSVSGFPNILSEHGGSVDFNAQIGAVAWAAGAGGKMAMAGAAGAQSATFNSVAGANASQAAATLPISPTVLSIGQNSAGDLQFNGYITRVSLWSASALSTAQQQAIET